MSEPCPRCRGTGCITDTSVACRGCCPDCQQPTASWSSESPEHRAAVRAFADTRPAKHINLTGDIVARKRDEYISSRKIDRTKYMTREEAAAYLGISFERVKPLIDRGQLKATQHGRWFYVERASAKAYKDKHP